LIFDESYFEAEVRDGFYVPGVMKRYWAAQLEIMNDIAKVCAEYEIKWFANYGTLIGAVRHGGFIPWDDDLDICMLRPDYERFLKVAEDALPEVYEVINNRTSEYNDLQTRIVSTKSICIEEEFLEKFHDIPYSVGIDIFVLDYVSDNDNDEAARKQLYSLVMTSAVSIDFTKALSQDEMEVLSLIEEMCNIQIDYSGNIKKQLMKVGDLLSALFPKEECSRVCDMKYWTENGNHIYPMDYFDEVIYVPFENTYIPVPKYYTGKLDLDYGNYIVPDQGGGLHNYPLYENNENELLRLISAEGFFKYDYQRMGGCTKRNINCDNKKILVIVGSTKEYEYAIKAIQRYATDKTQIACMQAPVFSRKLNGAFDKTIKSDFDIEMVKGVSLVKFGEYDFDAEHPDIIITTNGYDNCNQTITWPVELYTFNLKNKTDFLVYVQPFETEERTDPKPKTKKMMEYYVNIPAVGNCDEIIIWSKDNKTAYENYLSEKYGEDTKDIWAKKLVALVVPKNIRKDNEKKKLMYYINSAELGYRKGKSLDLIGERLEIIGKSSERLDCYLCIEKNGYEALQICEGEKERLNKYIIDFEDKFGSDKIYIEDSFDIIAKECDAYYGDAGPVVRYFVQNKKPVMMANNKDR